MFVYIAIVFLLTIAFRLIPVFYFKHISIFNYNNHFLSILTPDAALYGYYAKLLLQNEPHHSDVHLIEYLLYFSVKYLHFSIDQALFFLPAVLSSLIVLPTMLLANIYISSKNIVFLIGLLSGIGFGYYSRTYLGYYDTDILNIFFPMFMIYFCIKYLKNDIFLYLYLLLITNITYIFWYHSSLPLIISINTIFLLYYGYMLKFKDSKFYIAIILVAISLSNIIFIYKILLLIFLYLFFKLFKLNYRYFLFFYFFIFLFLLFNINIHSIFIDIQRYILKSSIFNSSNFFFVSPMQFVSEAQSSNPYHIIHLISGNIFIFILSLTGYFLLIYKHREIILSIPLVILGLLSIKAGVRFHIYAIMPFIISYMYLIYYITTKYKLNQIISSIVIFTYFLFPMYENYKSINFWTTKVSAPVFLPEQVMALNKLKKIAPKNSYVVTWWDYGWPIWYYTGLKTMIDNGRHFADNYTLSLILLSQSQKFSHNAINYFYDIFDKNRKKDAIVQALKKNKNIKQLFQKIYQGNFEYNKKLNKYLVLPIEMSKIVYSIYEFSNINPYNGKKIAYHVFKHFIKIKEDEHYIYFSNHSRLNKYNFTIEKNNKSAKIKLFTEIALINDKKMKRSLKISNRGFNLIKFFNNYYLMDDYIYNSTLIQLLYLNNYNKKYFSPIYEGQTISIYKIK